MQTDGERGGERVLAERAPPGSGSQRQRFRGRCDDLHWPRAGIQGGEGGQCWPSRSACCQKRTSVELCEADGEALPNSHTGRKKHDSARRFGRKLGQPQRNHVSTPDGILVCIHVGHRGRGALRYLLGLRRRAAGRPRKNRIAVDHWGHRRNHCWRHGSKSTVGSENADVGGRIGSDQFDRIPA